MTLAWLAAWCVVAVGGLAAAAEPPRVPSSLPARPGRRPQRRPDVAGALDEVVAHLRAGVSIVGALTAVAAARGDAVPGLARAVHRIGRGAEPSVALDDAARTTPDPVARRALASLALAHASGGSVVAALDRAAATARAEADLVAELRVQTAQARASAWVMAGVPLGLLGLMVRVDPAVASFVTGSWAGRASVLVGLALLGLGAAWMRALVAGVDR